MLNSLQYTLLLLLMTLLLVVSGMQLKKKFNVMSRYGIMAVLAYTLNEGMRFGRGVDYNIYGLDYESYSRGHEPTWDFGFRLVAKLLIEIGLPYQSFVILMSFLFICGSLSFLRSYKEFLPLALPLFVLFSNSAVENMVRFFMAFSIFLFGLKYCNMKSKLFFLYLIFSIFACTIHIAFLPIPIFFFLIRKVNRPIMHPLVAIVMFLLLAVSFDSDFMLQFSDIVNMLSNTSERFQHYGNRADYWLTGGYDGKEIQGVKLSDTLFYIVLAILGHMSIKKSDNNCVFAYNIYVVGMILFPVSLKIELINRYANCFGFFRAILLAIVLYRCFVYKTIKYNVAILASVLIFFNYGRRYFTEAFVNNSNLYLYLWNKGDKTYDKMTTLWLDKE